LLALGALLGAAAPQTASAQLMLYDQRLPDDTAYVRFVNVLDDAVTLEPDFRNPVKLANDGANRLSPYYVIEKAVGRTFAMDVAAGGARGHVAFQVKPASFSTVIVGRVGEAIAARVVEDQTRFNQVRARLTFYNTTTDCTAAALLQEAGGPPVFSGLPPASMRMRSINPVAARVVATCNTTRTPALDLGRLEAGGLYSVWLLSRNGKPGIFLAHDTIAPPYE
jgi:hypothetical protein